MGKEAKWLIAIKKIFSSESKAKKTHKSKRSKKRWVCGMVEEFDESSNNNTHEVPAPLPPPPPPPPPPQYKSSASFKEEIKLVDMAQEQNKHAQSIALASAVAAEAAAVAAQAAADIVRLTSSADLSTRSREELAAIKIQTAFRAGLARKQLQSLRGLVRLKALMQGNHTKRQATNTLHCMQTMVRVQSQIRARRIRMSEENQAFQKQLLMKHERDLEKLRMSEEWDDTTQSKEQVEANLLNKQEAAIRRERAMAYAFSHQWKASTRSVNPTFTDTSNPNWGWSRSERWMAARPWEIRGRTDKDANSDIASVKSVTRSVAGEITKPYARPDSTPEKVSPSAKKSGRSLSRLSPSTPPSKTRSTTGRKTKPASPRGMFGTPDEESGSVFSTVSERPRRHSLGDSLVRDDESFVSSSSVPSYMAPTESVKAKSKLQSPLGRVESPENRFIGTAKKRLSFTPAERHGAPPAMQARRHSGPPKVDMTTIKKDAGVTLEEET